MNIEKVKLKDGSEHPLGSAYFDGVSIDIDINTETNTADGEIEVIMDAEENAADPSQGKLTFQLYKLNNIENTEYTDAQLASICISDLTINVKDIETSSDLFNMSVTSLVVNGFGSAAMMIASMSPLATLNDMPGTAVSFNSDYALEGQTFINPLIPIIRFSQSDINSLSQDDQGNYVYSYENCVTLKIPSAGMYYATMAAMQNAYEQCHFTLSVGTYHIFDKTYLYPKLSNTIFCPYDNFNMLDGSNLKLTYSLYGDKRSEVIVKNAVDNYDDLIFVLIQNINDKEVWQFMKTGGVMAGGKTFSWLGGGYFLMSLKSSPYNYTCGLSYFPDYTTSVTSSTSKTITVDNAMYEEAVFGLQGSVTFTFDGTKWSSDNGNISHYHPNLVLSDIGITYPEGETPVADETITIDGRGHCLVMMVRGTLATES